MLRTVIREYTREAGVREPRAADRRRSAARPRRRSRRARRRRSGSTTQLREWLGPRRFSGEVRKRTVRPGRRDRPRRTPPSAATSSSSRRPRIRAGQPTVTGQLGEVMQESAQAALSWVRSHANALGVDPDWFEKNDIHVHVPAGAVPKDGPSAGVTMATAIASLVRGEPVAEDVGMTGEITLTGPGAPDRRHPREVARRAARGARSAWSCRARTSPTSPTCRRRRARRSRSSRRTRSRTFSEPHSTASAAGRVTTPAAERQAASPARLRPSGAGNN